MASIVPASGLVITCAPRLVDLYCRSKCGPGLVLAPESAELKGLIALEHESVF